MRRFPPSLLGFKIALDSLSRRRSVVRLSPGEEGAMGNGVLERAAMARGLSSVFFRQCSDCRRELADGFARRGEVTSRFASVMRRA